MKPPLKWVGSKYRLIKKIEPFIPDKIGTYFEPFLGAGAVFLSIKKPIAERYSLSDLNGDLIGFWKALQDGFSDLTSECKRVEDEYNNLANICLKKTYYETARGLFNSGSINKAVAFAFLNQAAFNSLVRYNKSGKFNSAFGKNERIKFNFANWREVHDFLKDKNPSIEQRDFFQVVDEAKEGDFIYLDPPYIQIGDRALDKGTYNNCDFDNYKLASILDMLTSKGVKWVFSNHADERLLNSLKSYNVSFCECLKKFSGKLSSRKPTREIIATNFLPRNAV